MQTSFRTCTSRSLITTSLRLRLVTPDRCAIRAPWTSHTVSVSVTDAGAVRRRFGRPCPQLHCALASQAPALCPSDLAAELAKLRRSGARHWPEGPGVHLGRRRVRGRERRPVPCFPREGSAQGRQAPLDMHGVLRKVEAARRSLPIVRPKSRFGSSVSLNWANRVNGAWM